MDDGLYDNTRASAEYGDWWCICGMIDYGFSLNLLWWLRR